MKRATVFFALFFALAHLASAVQPEVPPNQTCTWSVPKDFQSLSADSLAMLANGNVFVTNYGNELYKSTDKGATWTRATTMAISFVASDPTAPAPTNNVLYGTIHFIGARDKIVLSRDNGATWTQLGSPITIGRGDFVKPAVITGASAAGIYAYGKEAKIYKYNQSSGSWLISRDFAETGWTSTRVIHVGQYLGRVYAVVVQTGDATARRTKIFTREASGWVQKSVLNNIEATGNGLAYYETKLYLTTREENRARVRVSSDGGATWTFASVSSGASFSIIKAAPGARLNVLTSSNVLARSWDGTAWRTLYSRYQASPRDMLLIDAKVALVTYGTKVGKVTCNAWPVPHATASLPRRVGTQITLETRAIDNNADIISYAWEQVAGPRVMLSGNTGPQPYFVPRQAGTYKFTLKLRDNGLPEMPAGHYSKLNVTVVVAAESTTPAPGATPTPTPVAEVEEATPTPLPQEARVESTEQVPTSEPTPVPLTEEAQVSPEPTAQAEEVQESPTPTPMSAEPTPEPTASATPEATATPAPEATAEPAVATPTPMQAEATVAPAQAPAPTPAPTPSVKAANPQVTGKAGEVITLEVVGEDPVPTGKELSYAWRQVRGKPVELDFATTRRPSFVAGEGNYEFEAVTITSDGRRSQPATVAVTIVEEEKERNDNVGLARVLNAILEILKSLFG